MLFISGSGQSDMWVGIELKTQIIEELVSKNEFGSLVKILV